MVLFLTRDKSKMLSPAFQGFALRGRGFIRSPLLLGMASLPQERVNKPHKPHKMFCLFPIATNGGGI